MLTCSQILSFSSYLPSLNDVTRASLQTNLDMFAGILLQGSMDLWLLRWDTPFPSAFVRLVEGSPILSPFFKYKLPRRPTRITRLKVPKPPDDHLIRFFNLQAKVKRNTQTRLGQEITTQPKEKVSDIRVSFQQIPPHLRLKPFSKSLQGVAKNQLAQDPLDPKITSFFPTKASRFIPDTNLTLQDLHIPLESLESPSFPESTMANTFCTSFLSIPNDSPTFPIDPKINQYYSTKASCFIPLPSTLSLSPLNDLLATIDSPPSPTSSLFDSFNIGEPHNPTPSHLSSTSTKRNSVTLLPSSAPKRKQTNLLITRTVDTVTFREKIRSPLKPQEDNSSEIRSLTETREGVG
jgi:hypothetical protein